MKKLLVLVCVVVMLLCSTALAVTYTNPPAVLDALDPLRPEKNPSEYTYYENSVSSFGPHFRDIAPQLTHAWDMFTVIDFSEGNRQTFPLIAGNTVQVGNATVSKNGNNITVTATYKLDRNFNTIDVHSEYFKIFDDLGSIIPEDLVNLDDAHMTGIPVDCSEMLENDSVVILLFKASVTFGSEDIVESAEFSRHPRRFWENDPENVRIRRNMLRKIGIREYSLPKKGTTLKTLYTPDPYATYFGHNTVCSFGPHFRDHGGPTNKWFTFTVFDLKNDGIQTYDLIAGNSYLVGKVWIQKWGDEVTLTTGYIPGLELYEEYFDIFTDYDAITNDDLEWRVDGYEFGDTLSIENDLGGNTENLILFVCNIVSFSDDNPNLIAFSENENGDWPGETNYKLMRKQMLDKLGMIEIEPPQKWWWTSGQKIKF